MGFADYDILTDLGMGGQGIVKLVRNKSTQKLYAMKTFRATTKSVDAKKEYDVARHLLSFPTRSPFLVDIFEAFQEGSDYYIVMEHLHNSTDLVDFFNDIGDQKIRLDLVDLIDLLIQMANGVEYLHSHGLVHFDLKPENILIADGIIKLIDFGFTCLIQGEPLDIACQPKTIFGTLPYIAPEVISQRVTQVSQYQASDVYSLGIMFYEFLAMDVPYQRVDNKLIVTYKRGSRVDHARLIRAGLPKLLRLSEPFRRLIDHMIAFDPQSRLDIYQVILELFQLKQDVIRGTPRDP